MTAPLDSVEIPGFPGYRIDPRGVVWTWRGINGLPAMRWRRLSSDPGSRGHPKVRLCGPGGQRRFYVHRLVMQAFGGPPPSDQHLVCHNDGDPTNNHIDNLRRGTAQENWDDRRRHGRRLPGEDELRKEWGIEA